jgi:hypothetical protein
MAFLPPDPSRPFVNHKNGNPSDNRVENLEWTTQAENMEHARCVLHKGGERKLDEATVRELRLRYKGKVESLTHTDFKRIAAEYGMEKQAIKKMLLGVTWRHVEV